jgi:outer membrane receptor protein involved in Fe transport
MIKNLKLSTISIAIALTCQASNLLAAEQSTDNAKNEKIETIVVTGSFSGKAIKKEEASFAISTFNEDDFKKLAPQSTADLFKAVPGVWAESSGGVSGANIFVRGFPGSGDAPYVTVQIQGSPFFVPPTLSFLDNSALFRLDDTVEYMEALRGGTNPVVSNGQPGLTTNFLLKEGSSDTEGSVKYTTSDYGLQRIDGVVSGEIAEDLFIMVGGYIKSSPGARDAGFNAEEGNQFTINITKVLDNGKINFWTRSTDDHGTWYVPSALNVEGVDNTYTQIGTNNRYASLLVGTDNVRTEYDMGKGRGWDGVISGGSIDLSFDNGWNLVDRFSILKGQSFTHGLVTNGSASKLSEVDGVTDSDTNGVFATGVATGTQYGPNTDVQQFGRWIVEKELKSFTNDLILTKKFDQAAFTVGYFQSTYSANDTWALGHFSYHVVEQGGENLTGIACNDATSNADTCGWTFDIVDKGDATTSAVYSALSYDASDKLSVDIGLRLQNHDMAFVLDQGRDGSIDQVVSYDENTTSWTTGLNYMFTETQGVFARASEGSKLPFFDDVRGNGANLDAGLDLIQEVTQFELGYKLSSDDYSLYATVFFNETEGALFQVSPNAPTEITTNEAIGLEIDFDYYTDGGFSINLNATIQDTEITKGPLGQVGNQAQRQPGWQLRATPSYDVEFNNGVYASIYGTITAVDERYSSNANQITLDSYTKIDLGVQLNVTEEIQLQLSANNITDSDGLTEGDPRNITSPSGRYILPRTVNFSASYSF